MSDCPHCKRFREERDEAIEEARQLREDMARRDRDLAGPRNVRELYPTLSAKEGAIVQYLWERRAMMFVPRQQIMSAVYGASWDDRCSSTFSVHVYHTRNKLGADFIETNYAEGHRLSAEAREEIRAFMEDGIIPTVPRTTSRERRPGRNDTWRAVELATLRRMAEEGASSREISEELARLGFKRTPYAIIGKSHRMGVQLTATPGNTLRVQTRRRAA